MGIYRKKEKKSHWVCRAEKRDFFFFSFFSVTASSHLCYSYRALTVPSTLLWSLMWGDPVLGGVCMRNRHYRACAVAGVCPGGLHVCIQFCGHLWSWFHWACEGGKKLCHRLGSHPSKGWRTVRKAFSIFGWNCSFLTLLEFLHHWSSVKKPSSPPSLHLQPSNIYKTTVSWSLFVFHACIYCGQSLSNRFISVIFCSVWSWL